MCRDESDTPASLFSYLERFPYVCRDESGDFDHNARRKTIFPICVGMNLLQ